MCVREREDNKINTDRERERERERVKSQFACVRERKMTDKHTYLKIDR